MFSVASSFTVGRLWLWHHVLSFNPCCVFSRGARIGAQRASETCHARGTPGRAEHPFYLLAHDLTRSSHAIMHDSPTTLTSLVTKQRRSPAQRGKAGAGRIAQDMLTAARAVDLRGRSAPFFHSSCRRQADEGAKIRQSLSSLHRSNQQYNSIWRFRMGVNAARLEIGCGKNCHRAETAYSAPYRLGHYLWQHFWNAIWIHTNPYKSPPSPKMRPART